MTNSWWFITVLLYWQYKRVIMRCTYRTKEVLKSQIQSHVPIVTRQYFLFFLMARQQYSTVTVLIAFLYKYSCIFFSQTLIYKCVS